MTTIHGSAEDTGLQGTGRCGPLMALAHKYANYEHRVTTEYTSKEDLQAYKNKINGTRHQQNVLQSRSARVHGQEGRKSASDL